MVVFFNMGGAVAVGLARTCIPQGCRLSGVLPAWRTRSGESFRRPSRAAMPAWCRSARATWRFSAPSRLRLMRLGGFAGVQPQPAKCEVVVVGTRRVWAALKSLSGAFSEQSARRGQRHRHPRARQVYLGRLFWAQARCHRGGWGRSGNGASASASWLTQASPRRRASAWANLGAGKASAHDVHFAPV